MECKYKVAWIPWSKSLVDDSIFRGDENDYHVKIAGECKKTGIEIHTIDMYEDLNEVDAFLFSVIDYGYLLLLGEKGLLSKTIYFSGEPPVVEPLNSREGYEVLKKYFANIMTWDKNLVDNVRIFHRNIPYSFIERYGDPKGPKKLLVNMSGNKHSEHPLELYSTREEIVSWFEKNHLDQIELYGPGWDLKKHPSWKGCAKDKFEVYHNFKFALALENTHGVSGYLSEKLPDCLCAGIVPVYWGPVNVDEFVPSSCYIDYSRFSNPEKLYNYLANMPEHEYLNYLKEIDQFLKSEKSELFSHKYLAQCILDVIEKGYKEDLTLPLHRKIRFKMKVALQMLYNSMVNVKHGLLGNTR